MDIQSRKINLIQFVAGLQDVKLLNKIELAIKDEFESKRDFFSEAELLKRAEIANLEYTLGQVTSQENLEIEAKKW